MTSRSAPSGDAIRRDPRSAAAEARDLIVIGGGIYGVMALLEAARRGMDALLLERGDFGGETSWNSLRIVHGGLRYLQRADLPRFRRSVVERRWFLRTFPDLVEPLACLLPLYGAGARRPVVMRAALALNDLLSADRNAGVRPDRRLPPGRVLGRRRTLALVPGLRPEGLAGSARWFDASMRSSARVIVESLRWASAAGAVALNYVEAEEVVVSDGRVRGVRARDRVGDADLLFRAPAVINAAGPWARAVARRADRDFESLFRPSLGFNVLFDRPPPSPLCVGVDAPGPGGGTYFLRPWSGRLLAGTAHLPRDTMAGPGPTPAELDDFLEALNRGLPGLGLARDRVSRVFHGRLPAREAGGARPSRSSVVVDHGERGGPAGLVSVSGVKFTTARSVAERALRALYGSRLPDTRGDRPAGRVGGPDPWSAEALLAAAADGGGAAPERAVALCREESVVRVEDLLLRRTDWWRDERAAALGREVFAAASSP